ncbi:broad substrate specificity ATP-binding cassette transporter ABCG2-like [Marmota flaviventris]|uniref:broad substrate specificity ATP-binding cassette transporter ABCG2-like n=1 Tax=Marmota flaviventris TaxID=93162 RepID=UPI003A8BD5DD
MSSNNDLILNSDVLPGTSSRDQKGPVLSFHNICYHVKEKRGFLFNRKTTEKKKLSDINGIMKPGLNAIMGPSGGGKTLLLDILAARKDPSGLSGDVWVHGVPEDSNFPHNTGYVVQDDVVTDTLSVRENIWFSAALRLPTTMSKQEKNERINKVIKELDLEEVADSKVKSKGERKRTSIGMELILDPLILFLDRPTTGLDGRTANDVIRLLKRISEQGRMIIFSIHLPRYSIFQLFDSLTILASGELMYHGPAQRTLEYFESAGFPCEFYTNPAEIFLDFFHGVIKRESEEHEANKTEIPSKTDDSQIKELANNFAKSTFYKDIKTELHEFKRDKNKRCWVRKEIPYVTSFGHQLISLTKRSFQSFAGNPQHWINEIIVTLVLGLVTGTIILLLRDDCTEIRNRALMLFFLMVYLCRRRTLAVDLFMIQKKRFVHESISGYYRVSSYFFGSLLLDLLLEMILTSFIFIYTLYFMAGSKPRAETFFVMTFTLLIFGFSSISMTLALAAGYSKVSIQGNVVDTYFTFMLILSGVSLYFGTRRSQFPWLQYFSIPYYGFMALQHNEFLGGNFCPELNTTTSNKCPDYVICSGEEFLLMQDMDISPWGLWMNHVALSILMIFFLIIAYLRMLYLKRNS